ncbi:HIT family protein [Thauera sinica]|uniref:HIT family protein n=1 Tax=Thauera sinica TaxID=2665146 RepID=A0ABW1ARF9_9RHOO|nr:HIT family protein [Thauera sp. K11]ATE62153.1 HIT family protein [Thauera sp. K11]
MDCPLCAAPSRAGSPEIVLYEDEHCRVIRAGEPAYPGFCRVIWKRHVAEMTELEPEARRHLMDVVFATERALRELMQPDKINLASFGNMVPHLHWHVIPRFCDDRHFPEPTWGAPQREGVAHASPPAETLARVIASALARG